VRQRRLPQGVGARHVGLERLAGERLHHGDVLVGGGVEDHLGPVGAEHGRQRPGGAHVAHERVHNRTRRGQSPRLGQHVVDARLVHVEQDQLGGTEAEDLADDLRPDGAGRARDQYPAARQERGDGGRIGGHRLAVEQILDPDVVQVAHRHRLLGQPVDVGHHLDAAHAGGVQRFEHLLDQHVLGGGDAHDGGFHAVLGHHRRDVGQGARHGQAVDGGAGLAGVVVHERHRVVVDLGGAQELPGQPLAGGPGAHEQGAHAGALLPQHLAPDAPGDAEGADEEHAEHPVQEHHAAGQRRHPAQPLVRLDQGEGGHRPDCPRLQYPRHFPEPDVGPGHPVESERPEQEHLDDEQHGQPGRRLGGKPLGEGKLEPDEEAGGERKQDQPGVPRQEKQPPPPHTFNHAFHHHEIPCILNGSANVHGRQPSPVFCFLSNAYFTTKPRRSQRESTFLISSIIPSLVLVLVIVIALVIVLVIGIGTVGRFKGLKV